MVEAKKRTLDTVHVYINSNNKTKVGITNSIVEVNPYAMYEGNYIFTSSAEDQAIETKEKALLDNIIILKIPTYEIPNDAGMGFYIGGIEE